MPASLSSSRVFLAVAASGAVLGLGACSSTSQVSRESDLLTLDKVRAMHDEGRFAEAAGMVAMVQVPAEDVLLLQLERGTIEQDAGDFTESLESFNAAVASIEAADADGADGMDDMDDMDAADGSDDDSDGSYVAAASDEVLLVQSMIVTNLLKGDVTAAVDAARVLADEHRIHVETSGPDPIVLDAKFGPMIEPFMQSEMFVAAVEGSQAAVEVVGGTRILMGTWFPAWVALMAGGDLAGAETALGSIGWNLDEIDVDLAGAMLKRTQEGSLRDDVYVFFEAGMAPVLVETSSSVDLPILGTLAIRLPALQIRDQDRPTRLVISDDGAMLDTHQVGSIESVIAAEFADGIGPAWHAAVLDAAACRIDQMAAEAAAAQAAADAEAARLAAESAAASAKSASDAEQSTESGSIAADGASTEESLEVAEVAVAADEDSESIQVTEATVTTDGTSTSVEATQVTVTADETTGEVVATEETVVAEVDADASADQPAVSAAPAPAPRQPMAPDLRSWTTLPAIQHAAVIPHPAGGRLHLILDAGGGVPGASTYVVIPPGAAFVYVRSTASGNIVAHVATIRIAAAPSEATGAVEEIAPSADTGTAQP